MRITVLSLFQARRLLNPYYYQHPLVEQMYYVTGLQQDQYPSHHLPEEFLRISILLMEEFISQAVHSQVFQRVVIH